MRLKVRWVLIAVFLSVVSCSCSAPSAPVPHPPPPVDKPPEFEAPDITLTDDEIAKVIEIALSDPKISEWLKDKSEYRVSEVSFFYVWGGSSGSYASVRGTNPDSVPPHARIYPQVAISTGEEWIYQCQVFVNLQRERVRMIDGPYPALHSPGRIRLLSSQPRPK